MSDIAIRVENLSKLYRIGAQQESYRTLRDTLAGAAAAPFRRLKSAFQHSNVKTPERSDEFWALKDVSFEVKRGEVVGIIGRNGAGKSTLLKILSRITEPTGGYADIYGRVGSLLEVGTGFHQELTGRENTYLNGAILGMKRAEIDRRFDEIVAFAEIERFVDTPVKHYSSGMYLRLAFAVAAHLDPEILIVDEVLAVGDAEFQKKCLGKMGQVAREGRTVLLVSHNIGSIRTLCQRGVWLDRGEIVRLGDVQAVTDSYLQSAYVAKQTEVDLAAIVRQTGYGERARLTYVNMNKGTLIQHGEPLSVFFQYDSFLDMEDIAFGIGFCSPEGVRVLTIDSDMGEASLTHLQRGIGTVEMYINSLVLQPGYYMIDLGIRSKSHGVDYLQGCFQIEVLPGPHTPPHIIRRDGGVRLAATWKQL